MKQKRKKQASIEKKIWNINVWLQPMLRFLPYAHANERTLPQENKQQCWICSSLVLPQAVRCLMNGITEVHLMHSKIVIYGNINHRSPCFWQETETVLLCHFVSVMPICTVRPPFTFWNLVGGHMLWVMSFQHPELLLCTYNPLRITFIPLNADSLRSHAWVSGPLQSYRRQPL